MKRETSNAVRFVLEELLPPIARDSRLFRWLAGLAWGGHIEHLAQFRSRAASLTDAEFEALYRRHPRVHDGTDNSAACVRRIVHDVLGRSVLDVGCGTGFLLQAIAADHPPFDRITGLDLVLLDTPDLDRPDLDRPDLDRIDFNRIEFVEGRIERLPFLAASFDTVVCTHVVEHILDLRAAIAELRRVARRRLIIVVPCEREGLTTFNPHFHFFPYSHSFLRAMIPLPERHQCLLIGRDIYYVEELEPAHTTSLERPQLPRPIAVEAD